MKAARWITLWTCSLDGDFVIECRARRNPKDDAVTVRMPGERRGSDYLACYVDEYYAATRDGAITQFIERQRRYVKTWRAQVDQAQQKDPAGRGAATAAGGKGGGVMVKQKPSYSNAAHRAPRR